MFERLVGLNVSDANVYQQYRDGMMPILALYEGRFVYDFIVSDTMFNESGHPINRVFILSFPDEGASDRFFNDAGYKKVRATFFDASVENTTIIAQFNKTV